MLTRSAAAERASQQRSAKEILASTDQAAEREVLELIEQAVPKGEFTPEQKQVIQRQIYEGVREVLVADKLFQDKLNTLAAQLMAGHAKQEDVVRVFIARVKEAIPEVAERVLKKAQSDR